MRTLTALLFAALVLSGTAFAEDGFVIDTRDPKASRQMHDFSSGELVVEDIYEPLPLLILTLEGGPFNAEPMLFSVHPGETVTYPFMQPNAAGVAELYGVVQLKEFSQGLEGQQGQPTEEIAEMLVGGKRFVINNLELVIYVPGSESFRAELLEGGRRRGEPGRIDIKGLPLPMATGQRANNSLGWISGSL